MRYLKYWIKRFFDLLLPPRCLMCGRVVHNDNCLCVDCFKNVNFISSPYCKHCGLPLSYGEAENMCCAKCLGKKSVFRFSRSAVKYDDGSKRIILNFKFADHLENKILLSNWLYMAGKDIFDDGVDLIIPVPLHITRLFKRRYNQSAVLAARLSELSNIPADFKSLKKIKRTVPQMLCNGNQRLRNVKKSFQVTSSANIKGKRIVLIDDVYTTGSTLKECAKVLKKAGAKSVDTLTIARVC